MKSDEVPVRVEFTEAREHKGPKGGGEIEAWNDRIMRMVGGRMLKKPASQPSCNLADEFGMPGPEELSNWSPAR